MSPSQAPDQRQVCSGAPPQWVDRPAALAATCSSGGAPAWSSGRSMWGARRRRPRPRGASVLVRWRVPVLVTHSAHDSHAACGPGLERSHRGRYHTRSAASASGLNHCHLASASPAGSRFRPPPLRSACLLRRAVLANQVRQPVSKPRYEQCQHQNDQRHDHCSQRHRRDREPCAGQSLEDAIGAHWCPPADPEGSYEQRELRKEFPRSDETPEVALADLDGRRSCSHDCQHEPGCGCVLDAALFPNQIARHSESRFNWLRPAKARWRPQPVHPVERDGEQSNCQQAKLPYEYGTAHRSSGRVSTRFAWPRLATHRHDAHDQHSAASLGRRSCGTARSGERRR